MTEELVPPPAVYQACLRGLELLVRRKAATDDHGATAASVAFATAVAEGFTVDRDTATELVFTHAALSQEADPAKRSLLRALWGGDAAAEWAASIVDQPDNDRPAPQPTTPAPASIADDTSPAPLPVAAAAGDEPDAILEALSLRLHAMEDRVIAGLESAFWMAYRAALRQAGATARSKVYRVPKAVQAAAGLGEQELNEARHRMRQAHPYDVWSACGEAVLAAVDADLDRAVQSALDDYETTATSILEGGVDQSAAAVAVALGIGREAVDAAAPSRDSVRLAVTGLRSTLLEWVRTRLAGDREAAELQELSIPTGIFARAVSTAGGSSPTDLEQSIGSPMLGSVLAAVATGRVTSRVLGAIPVPRSTWTWSYGAPSDRNSPFLPHVALDGEQWESREEKERATEGYFPGDHAGCKCRIRRSFRVGRIGA